MKKKTIEKATADLGKSLTETDLLLSSTKFKYQREHKITFTLPGQTRKTK